MTDTDRTGTDNKNADGGTTSIPGSRDVADALKDKETRDLLGGAGVSSTPGESGYGENSAADRAADNSISRGESRGGRTAPAGDGDASAASTREKSGGDGGAAAAEDAKRLQAIADQVADKVVVEQGTYPDVALNNGKIHSAFIEACLQCNELGDGVFYVVLNKGRLIHNVTAAEWLLWTGQYWAADDHNNYLSSVELIVDRLLEETVSLTEKINWAIKGKQKGRQKELEGKRDAIYKRVSRLRTDRGRNACVKFAISCRDPITIKSDNLDLDPWLFGCVNGTIDLRSGKFRDGDPFNYISKVSPVEFQGLDAPAPLWNAFILDIMSGNHDDPDAKQKAKDMAAYMQRLLGYAMTGLTREHIMPVFWGKGRNGKTTLVKILLHVMGAMAGTIQPEMLLYQRMQRNTSGASPEIMDLKGLRMAFADETEEGQRFSASKVKQYTGSNQLVGRDLYGKKQVRFNPTHTIFLQTNSKPSVAGDDYAFWKRMHLIPFKLSYVNKDREELEPFERVADPDIEEKLKAEAPGILAWLVRGCLAYLKEGLNPPQTVLEATLEYQQEEDILGSFLEAYCNTKATGAETKSSDIFDKFDKWYKANLGSKGISHKRFGTMMKKRFDTKKKVGVVYYIGVELDPVACQELSFQDRNVGEDHEDE